MMCSALVIVQASGAGTLWFLFLAHLSSVLSSSSKSLVVWLVGFCRGFGGFCFFKTKSHHLPYNLCLPTLLLCLLAGPSVMLNKQVWRHSRGAGSWRSQPSRSQAQIYWQQHKEKRTLPLVFQSREAVQREQLLPCCSALRLLIRASDTTATLLGWCCHSLPLTAPLRSHLLRGETLLQPSEPTGRLSCSLACFPRPQGIPRRLLSVHLEWPREPFAVLLAYKPRCKQPPSGRTAEQGLCFPLVGCRMRLIRLIKKKKSSL